MFDDDLPKPKASAEFPRNLENMSVDELEVYVETLKSEIQRVEEDKARKAETKAAADSVFKS